MDIARSNGFSALLSAGTDGFVRVFEDPTESSLREKNIVVKLHIKIM
jgi:hypothetical protein